jgi:hypothetical protein
MMLSLPQGTYAEEKAKLLHRGDVRFGRLSFMAYRGVGRLAPERFELRPPRAVGLGFESSDDVGLLVFVASLASTGARPFRLSLPSAGWRVGINHSSHPRPSLPFHQAFLGLATQPSKCNMSCNADVVGVLLP